MVEGKNIVSYDVLFSVMLVETAAFTTVYQVVLHNDTCTSFIRIKSPTSIVVRVNVMDHIIANPGTG